LDTRKNKERVEWIRNEDEMSLKPRTALEGWKQRKG